MAAGRSGRASRKRVGRWPQYLLTNIPDEHRGWLSSQAAESDTSIADVIRGLLCARYRLKCPPESYGYDPARDSQSPNMVLRLQPRLSAKLEFESIRTGHAKRRIILDAIKNSYERSSK